MQLTRGDFYMSDNIKHEAKHVVEDFMLGNSRIKLCDDYCRNRSDKDIDAILLRIVRKAKEHFTANARQK